jgi:hypothetical protein
MTYRFDYFTTEDGDKRYTVWEDTVAIYETGDRQEAERYAQSCNHAAARIAG